VSLIPQSLYPQGKGSHYPLNRRLGEPQNQWTVWRRVKSFANARISMISCPAFRPLATLTILPILQHASLL
jgi:hypothetical protein